MIDNMKIELGRYYHFDDLQNQWEENYPESEPLTIDYLIENLSPEILLHEVEGNYVAFHLKGLGDISQITEGTLTVERCKIDFKNPKIFTTRVNACGLDQGSHTESVVSFQDSDKNFFVDLENANHERVLVNIKNLFTDISAEAKEKGYVYHIPARGVVVKKDTTSINRSAHNANCRPNFSELDASQSTLKQLIISKDSYRPLNHKEENGLNLTVFDKPYLSIENLSRRLYCNSNCTFVYSSGYLHSKEYFEKYNTLLNLNFRFPDHQKVFHCDKTEAPGYGTVSLLGNSTEKNASNYDQYTENFAKNFQKLFGEELSLDVLRKHRIYIEIFNSDQGGDTRDCTMQSFTLDPPKKRERECVIRPCWMGYRGEKFTGGKFQSIIFKDAIVANLIMALIAHRFENKNYLTEEVAAESQEKIIAEQSWNEGKEAFGTLEKELKELEGDKEEFAKFASYADLLQIPLSSDIVKNAFLDDEHGRPAEIDEVMDLTEKILSAKLNEPVNKEISTLNSEKLLKYFRLDQKPVTFPNEYCRHPSLIYNIPLSGNDVPLKIMKLIEKIENLKFTTPDGSKIRFKDALVHIADLIKIKWSNTLEASYTESFKHKIETSRFQYESGKEVVLSLDKDKELIHHFSHGNYCLLFDSFIAGLCGTEIEQITKVDLFRMAQLFLPVICAEESNNFALINKRREHFYFAPASDYKEEINSELQKFVKRAKIALRESKSIFDKFPEKREDITAETFVIPLSETIRETLANVIGIVKEFRSEFPDTSKSWESFAKLYKKQPRSKSLQKWENYCKEKDNIEAFEAKGAETCEIELKNAADEIRKNEIAAPVSVSLKKRQLKKTASGSDKTKFKQLMDDFLECSKKTFRTEDWSLILAGMSYYMAMLGEENYAVIETLSDTFEKTLSEKSSLKEEFEIFKTHHKGFWLDEEDKDGKFTKDVTKSFLKVYKKWLTRVKQLLDEIRDSERIQGVSVEGYRVNQEICGTYTTDAKELNKPQINSFVFYMFSGQGTNILHKFMAKHINNSFLLKNVTKFGHLGYVKGYRSQVHFLDIDSLFQIVFRGEKETKDAGLFEIVRKNISKKLITPLGLSIIGSYRCSADNKITFKTAAEVELDPYDLIGTSSMGPELENQVEYIFSQELVSFVEDQRPVNNFVLSSNMKEPKNRIYFVPSNTKNPPYFKISKNGGNVNIWKRVQSRLKYGCSWLPQSYFFLGCFEFPEFESDMELFLLPMVTKSHKTREDSVAIFFKNKYETILDPQANREQKFPAKILKLWDKDHDSAGEQQVYQKELFEENAFILQELWPKHQLIAALTGQCHFRRFKMLAEI